MSISRSLGVRILPKDGQRKKAPGIHEDVLIYRISYCGGDGDRQAERYQTGTEKALHQIRAVLYFVRSVPAGIG